MTEEGEQALSTEFKVEGEAWRMPKAQTSKAGRLAFLLCELKEIAEYPCASIHSSVK